jgi:biopolymer transport protein ExbB/TolQ
MQLRSEALVLEAVERHSAGAAAAIHQEMKRGVNSLATIASVAPRLGLLLTLRGIVFSFGGGSGEKTAMMAALASRLSESLMPTALGLVVSVPALWWYKYLSSRVKDFDVEMKGATADLVSCLRIHRARALRAPAARLAAGFRRTNPRGAWQLINGVAASAARYEQAASGKTVLELQTP